MGYKILNCNLDSIRFIDTFNLEIQLSNSFDGEKIGFFRCAQISYFNFHSVIDFNEEGGLPTFIFEINIFKITELNQNEILKKIDFKFEGFEDAKKNMKVLIEISGNEVDVIAICKEVSAFDQNNNKLYVDIE